MKRFKLTYNETDERKSIDKTYIFYNYLKYLVRNFTLMEHIGGNSTSLALAAFSADGI